MGATISYYPQVSEWIFLGDTAVNLAQVASIEFAGADDRAHAIVRLASYRTDDEVDGAGTTWFKVTRRELVEHLQRYVRERIAPA